MWRQPVLLWFLYTWSTWNDKLDWFGFGLSHIFFSNGEVEKKTGRFFQYLKNANSLAACAERNKVKSRSKIADRSMRPSPTPQIIIETSRKLDVLLSNNLFAPQVGLGRAAILVCFAGWKKGRKLIKISSRPRSIALPIGPFRSVFFCFRFCFRWRDERPL